LRKSATGWVTAEYACAQGDADPFPTAILPKEKYPAHQEIQRLIGRSLRAVTDMTSRGKGLSPSIVMSCRPTAAHGQRRLPALTWALYLAMDKLANMGVISSIPLNSPVAVPVSASCTAPGWLDLCYDENSNADADFNVVMTGKGEFVEIQGTAEKKPYNKESVDSCWTGRERYPELFAVQQAVIDCRAARKIVQRYKYRLYKIELQVASPFLLTFVHSAKFR